MWGEHLGVENNAKVTFLSSENLKEGGFQKNKQKKIECLTGMNWLIFELVRDLAKSASQIASDFELMRGWGDWQPQSVEGQGGPEGDKVLWSALEECDRQAAGSVNTDSNIKNKPKDNKPKTKSKKRGKLTKVKIMKGQRLMDMFVIKVEERRPENIEIETDDGEELLLC